MTRNLRKIALLAAMAWIVAPTPAQACVAVLAPVCELIDGSNILRAVGARVEAYVSTLLEEVGMKHAEKLSQAESQVNQVTSKQTLMRDSDRDQDGPSGASCAIGSIGMDYIRGGRANSAYVNPQQNFGGTGASEGAKTQPRLQPFNMPSPLTKTGGYAPIGAALADPNVNTAGITHDEQISSYVNATALRNQRRRDGLMEGSGNQLQDAKTQFDFHDNNFADPAQPLFFNADLKVQTIFDNDTFPTTKNTPKVVIAAEPYNPNATLAQQIAAIRAAQEALTKGNSPLTLADAADRYCQNLAEPTIQAPNRGPVKAQSTDRQIYTTQRNGWDARLSLARSICDEAVARRIAKPVPQSEKTSDAATPNANAATPGDWFTSTMLEYRTIACNAKANASEADKNACLQAVDEMRTSKAANLSEFEMSKIIYTRMLFTPNAAKLLGAANQTDMSKMILQLDQLQVMLNYRIYEMQEKIALIKAAQLATMVESTRSQPKAETPGAN